MSDVFPLTFYEDVDAFIWSKKFPRALRRAVVNTPVRLRLPMLARRICWADAFTMEGLKAAVDAALLDTHRKLLNGGHSFEGERQKAFDADEVTGYVEWPRWQRGAPILGCTDRACNGFGRSACRHNSPFCSDFPCAHFETDCGCAWPVRPDWARCEYCDAVGEPGHAPDSFGVLSDGHDGYWACLSCQIQALVHGACTKAHQHPDSRPLSLLTEALFTEAPEDEILVFLDELSYAPHPQTPDGRFEAAFVAAQLVGLHACYYPNAWTAAAAKARLHHFNGDDDKPLPTARRITESHNKNRSNLKWQIERAFGLHDPERPKLLTE